MFYKKELDDKTKELLINDYLLIMYFLIFVTATLFHSHYHAKYGGDIKDIDIVFLNRKEKKIEPSTKDQYETTYYILVQDNIYKKPYLLDVTFDRYSTIKKDASLVLRSSYSKSKYADMIGVSFIDGMQYEIGVIISIIIMVISAIFILYKALLIYNIIN